MAQPPYFFTDKLHKFQICCHPKCENDATSQIVVEMKDGSAYYLPLCSEENHLKQGQTNAHKIKRNPPKQLNINVEELCIRPLGFTGVKCKYAQWITFIAEIENGVRETNQLLPKTQAKQRKTMSGTKVEAIDGWTWISNIDKWMDVNGEVVRITSLRSAELISAINAIIENNFSRVTKRISWVKELVKPTKQYIYPEEELKVGVAVAHDKLEEFQEAADELGLI